MGLEEFWFVLIGVLWGGYFLLEGFDFGVGMLLPVLPRDERERERDVRVDRAGVGRQRGLAGRSPARATFAAFPAWYATMFSGFYLALLLHPRAADRPRRLVRVAREARRARAGAAAWLWANTVGSFGAAFIWGVALANLVARRAAGLLARVHRQRARPLQRLHGARRPGGGRVSSRATARHT